jgi:large subunit ribosomal protein L15
MLRLNNLKPAEGSKFKKKRIGRGQGSGQGTQAGKGHKGQKARTGGGVRIGFEGGSMPLYMRLPKTGEFSNAPFRKKVIALTLKDIDRSFDHDEEINHESLLMKKLLNKKTVNFSTKIIGNFPLNKKLRFTGDFSFSEQAKGLLEKAGCVFQKKV